MSFNWNLYKARKKIRPPSLNINNINQALVGMESLTSEVHARFLQHKEDMQNGETKPFTKLIAANMGNPHSYGQPCITFVRQLLAVCLNPRLLEDSRIPSDVKKRATTLLNKFPNKSLGAITNPIGLPLVRRNVAMYLRERDDGVPAKYEDIFLQDCGKLVDSFFGLLTNNDEVKPVGILTPVPTYPIYPALIHKHRMCQVVYYLNQDKNWAIDINHLKQVIHDARLYCRVKGVVIINPGNPTGQVLTRANIEDIIKLCYNEELFIFADEVYQDNIQDCKAEFHAFKKVKHRMADQYKELELVSLNSASKGYLGECGFRGGYIEFDKVHNSIKKAFEKALTTLICPNPVGQIAIDVIVNPPRKNEPSWPLFQHEKQTILVKMAQKAKFLVNRLNTIKGLKVTPMQGGLFAYPQITKMPCSAIQEAQNSNISPSLFWALELLDRTGIAVTPGSTFMENPGKYHFRVPILLPIEDMEDVVQGIKTFHKEFVKTYE